MGADDPIGGPAGPAGSPGLPARGLPARGLPTRSDAAGVVPGEIRLSALILVAQAAGLALIAVALMIKTVSGGANSLARAAAVAGFVVGGAALLLLAASALLRLRPGARTPVLVLELLTLPVAYSLGIQAGRIWYGGPLLVSAMVLIYLLVAPATRRALGR